MKKLIIFSVISFLCLNSNFAFAEDKVTKPKNNKPIDIKIPKKSKPIVKEKPKEEENTIEEEKKEEPVKKTVSKKEVSTNKTNKTSSNIDIELQLEKAKIYNEQNKFDKSLAILAKITPSGSFKDDVYKLFFDNYSDTFEDNLNDDFISLDENTKNLEKAKYYLNLIKDEGSKERRTRTLDRLYKDIEIEKVGILVKNRDYKNAIIKALKISETVSRNSRLNTFLGIAKFKTGEKKEGLDLVKKATTIVSNRPFAFYELAILEASNDNEVEAINNLKKAIALDETVKYKAKKASAFKNLSKNAEFISLTK